MPDLITPEMKKHEKQFYKALQDLFVGAKIEGDSGFINLMRIKSKYFEEIMGHFKQDVEEELKPFPEFREELFDKLYSFFSRYFSENGSLYFQSTPFHQNIYEKVYTDEKDVILFWKTHMLYYVKTDRLFKSMEIEEGGIKFFFDVSKLEHKRTNEKRDLVYKFDEKRNNDRIVFNVFYSERGKKTNIEDLQKQIAKSKDRMIDAEILGRVLKVFEKQSEVDYFINKNAKAFLQEQYDLWAYQYLFQGQNIWDYTRIQQLQTLREQAFKLIDFISQFEDELVRIWNKPKFVRKSNYVITLDKIKNKKIVEKLLNHKGMKEQEKEWQELGVIDEIINVSDISKNKNYAHLPFDTKYFKDLELEILSLFDDLDDVLDGWLINSENYQALNTILPKFKEQVKTIYIDPPFNTGDDFPYVDRFQNSSWLSLINDRVSLSKQFLMKSGSFLIHLDHNAEHIGRILLESIFKDGFINNLAWSYRTGGASKKTSLPYKHDSLLLFARDIDHFEYYPIYERQYLEKSFMGSKQDEEGRFYVDTLLRDVIEGVISDFTINKVFNTRPVINLSNEFYGFKTQKPEGLLYLLQYITSKTERTLFLDFFAGTGTSLIAAHKQNKKWLGIEIGNHVNNFYQDNIELNNTAKNKRDLYRKYLVLEYHEDEKKINALVKKMGILGRLKQVLCCCGRNEPCGITESINWQGGGFFKYYELEQYDDVLRQTTYEDCDLLESGKQDIYNEYMFMRDKKMTGSIEVDHKENKVKVDFSKLYENVDIPETLSNLLGKKIKRISKDSVEFSDGTIIDVNNLDFKMIKPMIWWGS